MSTSRPTATLKRRPRSLPEQALRTVERYLKALPAESSRVSAREFGLRLEGSSGQSINVHIEVGDYTATVESFFMRTPKDNIPETHRLMLRKNLEMQAVRFCIDDFGDIFLKADVPLRQITTEVLDTLLGQMQQHSDRNWPVILKLGWESEMGPADKM